MFCNSTGQEFDIFCDVLPDNGTTITLNDAHDLCLKKNESEFVNETETIVGSSTEDQEEAIFNRLDLVS